MAQEQPQNQDLDVFIAEMGGEEAVVAIIEETKRRAADGTLPAFNDRESFLAYFRQGSHSQSA